MITYFVCADDCYDFDNFKQAHKNAIKEDIVIIKYPFAMPRRTLENKFLDKANKGAIKLNCFILCLRTCNPKVYSCCIASALTSAALGDLDNGFAYAD